MRPSAHRLDRRAQLRREYRSRGIHFFAAPVLVPIPVARPTTIQTVVSVALARRLATLMQS